MMQRSFVRQFVTLSLALGLLAPVALASGVENLQDVSGPETLQGKGKKPKPVPTPKPAPGPRDGGGEDS